MALWGVPFWLIGCARQEPPKPQLLLAPQSAPVSSATKLAEPQRGGSANLGQATTATRRSGSIPDELPQLDLDGSDEPESEGSGPAPTAGHFERVGRAPISLRQICDLTPLGERLFAAHSLSALSADGATVSSYQKSDQKHPFTVAFDWNRPGQPAKGGGAGQGFLRVRNIGGRLFVPDADPPYNGFGLLDWGTEGYLFVSSPDGKFAPSLRPNFRPPGRPTLAGKPGASVLPRAYHVFDVIRFRGKLIASTGAVPPKERAWVGPSPGALHIATDDLSRFDYAFSYPNPYHDGVYRLTFLVRFKDKLFAGIEDYDGRALHDLVVLAPPRDRKELSQEMLQPLRITEGGAAQTMRFYTHQGVLYWIAWGHDGVRLRRSTDGEHFTPIGLPVDAGAPLDIVGYRGALYVLAEYGLYRYEPNNLLEVARIPGKSSPFQLRDALCAAPLAVFDNDLYAGSQRDGALYRFVAEAPAEPSAAGVVAP